MSYQTLSDIDPLPDNERKCSYPPNNQIYIRVPYRTKKSANYRNFAKSLGGQYDPISERWYIPQVRITEETVKIINDKNMFDGYRYSRPVNPDTTQYYDIYSLKEFPIFKCIQYTQHKSVHFYTFKDYKYVQLVYFSGSDNNFNEIFSNIDHVRKFSVYDNLMPRTYAREEYLHYSNIKDAKISDVPYDYAKAFFGHFKHVSI